MLRLTLTTIFVVLGLLAQGQSGDRIADESQRASALSMSPAHFFLHGAQLNWDVPVSARSSLRVSRSDIFSYRPTFLSNSFFFFGIPDFPDFGPVNLSELQAVAMQELAIALKYPVFKKSGLLNGYYWGPELRHSTFNSITWENISSGAIQAHRSERSVFVQAGLTMGWQRRLGNSGFADISLSFLFNTFTSNTEPILIIDGPLINSDLPMVAQAGISLGGFLPTLKSLESVRAERSDKIALTLDLAALLRMGAEMDIHVPVKGHRTFGLKTGIYNSPEYFTGIYDQAFLSNFNGYRVGVSMRQYWPERPVFNGPFLELGTSYREVDVHFFEGSPRKEQVFGAYSGNLTLGLSKIYSDFFLVEASIANRLILATDRLRKRYPGADFSSGISTEIGLRVGIVL